MFEPKLPNSFWELALPIFLVILSYILFKHTRKLPAPYPPGPPAKPIVGNAFDLPSKMPWSKYMEWAKEVNSSVIHVSALSTHIVILHTVEDAVELMEKRSTKYSSRIPSPLLELYVRRYSSLYNLIHGDSINMDNLYPFMSYGNGWRKQRRLTEEGLRKSLMPSYHPVLEEKVHLLLDQLLRNPAGFKEHCRDLGTSIPLAMQFGYDLIPGHKDHFVKSAEFAIDRAVELMLPGSTLVSVFPFLRYIPPWVPGASTQRLCAQVRAAVIEYKNRPFEFVKENVAAGISKPCVLATLLERRNQSDGSYEDEEALKNSMAALFLGALARLSGATPFGLILNGNEGGIETMQAAQITFIMAMTLHPHVQKKAQEEIDRVIGTDRLPTIADRASLPYTEAVFRENWRWRPTSLGTARATTEDDIYKGFYIPKGSVVMANIWAMTRNETTYPEPEIFRPERFFRTNGTLNDDTISYVFGCGRRACPGKRIGELAVWLMIASVLATFDISKAKDENGKDIEVDVQGFSNSFSSHPPPFKCSITPRSPRAEALVLNASSNAQKNLRRRNL